MYGFAYKIDEEHGYRMEDLESRRAYTSAYKGLIYADRDTKAIMVIKMETVGIPADFPIHDVKIQLDYAPSKIGDQEFVLPYHYQLNSRADNAISSNEADYKLYRKYGAEASITFGDVDSVPADKPKDDPDKPGGGLPKK